MDKGELNVILEAVKHYCHRMDYHDYMHMMIRVDYIIYGVLVVPHLERGALKNKATEIIRHDRFINR